MTAINIIIVILKLYRFFFLILLILFHNYLIYEFIFLFSDNNYYKY